MAKAKEDLDASLAEIDGELPAHLQPPMNDDSGIPGTGITAADVYGGDNAADRAKDLGPDAELGGPQDPTDATDPANQSVKDEEPDEESEEAPEEPEPEDKPVWDKERQRRDQTIANLRKENIRLRSTLDSEAEKPDEKTSAQEEADEALKDLAELDPDIADLDDVIQAQNRVVAALKQQKADFKAELADIQASTSADDQADADAEAFETLIDEACETVGEQLRTAIVKSVNEAFSERKYSDDNLPPEEQVRDLVFSIAHKAHAEHLVETAKAAKKKKTKAPVPRTDTVSGGSPADILKGTAQDVDEAWDQMEREGQLGWLGK